MPYAWRLRVFSLGMLAGLLSASAAARDWLPVTDAERNLKEPRVEKDAGAEALFWNIHVEQTLGYIPTTTYENYIRIKVFTQHGCETQSTMTFPESSAGSISGRTIKPDGRIVEAGKDALSVRNVVAAKGLKINRISFVLPGVEPGDIIEYRWSEIHSDYSYMVRLDFQRDIPVQQVKYFIKAVSPSDSTVVLSWEPFQANFPPLAKSKDGYYTTSMENVPAYVEEPLAPPAAQVKPWLLLHYTPAKKTPAEYWKEIGKDVFGKTKRSMKANDAVRRAAEEATGQATDPEEKLARLARYCRAHVKNVDDDDITERQREKAKQNWSPADTLKRGLGTNSDVRMLFAALASGAGFDPRLALVANRADIRFNPMLRDAGLLPHEAIAVKVGDQWRFYDVAVRDLPTGMLPWEEEGVDALVADPDDAVFARTQFSPPETSVTVRNGTFELTSDGELVGEVLLAYSGHAASGLRRDWKVEAAAQREKDLRETVRKQFESAEVSDIRIDNLEDAEQPLTCFYRVKIPSYAQKTGKRMFVQLGYFERDRPALLPLTSRRYPVVFDHAWSEDDQVTMKVPAGYALESPDAPAPLALGAVGEYQVSVKAGAGMLVYQRKLAFGRGGRLTCPQSAYPQLKQVFDTIHERDQRALTLRQSAPAAAASH